MQRITPFGMLAFVRAEGYAGRPFLRLLELYVLSAIGELDKSQVETLERMTPKLQETYSCSGTWLDCVAAAMEFPSNMPDLIRERWEHNRRLAQAHGEELLAEDFASMFTDANFADGSP